MEDLSGVLAGHFCQLFWASLEGVGAPAGPNVAGSSKFPKLKISRLQLEL
jgi:hypothetical protein